MLRRILKLVFNILLREPSSHAPFIPNTAADTQLDMAFCAMRRDYASYTLPASTRQALVRFKKTNRENTGGCMEHHQRIWKMLKQEFWFEAGSRGAGVKVFGHYH